MFVVEHAVSILVFKFQFTMLSLTIFIVFSFSMSNFSGCCWLIEPTGIMNFKISHLNWWQWQWLAIPFEQIKLTEKLCSIADINFDGCRYLQQTVWCVMDWLVSEYVNCANKYPVYAAKQRSQSSIKQYRNPFKFCIEFWSWWHEVWDSRLRPDIEANAFRMKSNSQ